MYGRVVILAILVLSIAAAFLPHPVVSIPYFRTISGALLGGALIAFGPQLQRGLSGLAARQGRSRHGEVHSSR